MAAHMAQMGSRSLMHHSLSGSPCAGQIEMGYACRMVDLACLLERAEK